MCGTKRGSQLFFLIWGCFKKVIMIDNQIKWLSASPGERGRNDNSNSTTTTQRCCFSFPRYINRVGQKVLPLGVIFFLVQDEWQHTLFFTFYDLDMSRTAQGPLWCLSETARAAPSHQDFIQEVSFGPLILREVSSLEANCWLAWIVDFVVKDLQKGDSPPSGYINCIW